MAIVQAECVTAFHTHGAIPTAHMAYTAYPLALFPAKIRASLAYLRIIDACPFMSRNKRKGFGQKPGYSPAKICGICSTDMATAFYPSKNLIARNMGNGNIAVFIIIRRIEPYGFHQLLWHLTTPSL